MPIYDGTSSRSFKSFLNDFEDSAKIGVGLFNGNNGTPERNKFDSGENCGPKEENSYQIPFKIPNREGQVKHRKEYSYPLNKEGISESLKKRRRSKSCDSMLINDSEEYGKRTFYITRNPFEMDLDTITKQMKKMIQIKDKEVAQILSIYPDN